MTCNITCNMSGDNNTLIEGTQRRRSVLHRQCRLSTASRSFSGCRSLSETSTCSCPTIVKPCRQCHTSIKFKLQRKLGMFSYT